MTTVSVMAKQSSGKPMSSGLMAGRRSKDRTMS
jgi:hypothetical protein